MLHSPYSNDEIYVPEFIDIAVRMASDADTNVRMEACRVLSTYVAQGRRDAQAALFGLLGDSHEHTRSWALLALSELQDRRIVDVIEQELQAYDAHFTTEPPAEMFGRMNVLYETINRLPDARYLPFLNRWAKLATNDDVGNWCDDLIKACRRAKPTKGSHNKA